MIIRNAARCTRCDEVVESKHRHDFQRCSCGAVAVDGGLDYLKRCGEPDHWEDLTILEGEEDERDEG